MNEIEKRLGKARMRGPSDGLDARIRELRQQAERPLVGAGGMTPRRRPHWRGLALTFSGVAAAGAIVWLAWPGIAPSAPEPPRVTATVVASTPRDIVEPPAPRTGRIQIIVLDQTETLGLDFTNQTIGKPRFLRSTIEIAKGDS